MNAHEPNKSGVRCEKKGGPVIVSAVNYQNEVLTRIAVTGLIDNRADDHLGDALLDLGRHGDEGETGRPHRTVIQIRGDIESERAIADLELSRRLEETDVLSVLVIRRHSVPGFGGKFGRCGHDQFVDAPGEYPIAFIHRLDDLE